MSEQPAGPDVGAGTGAGPHKHEREPDTSPQRKLVDSIKAYEVDPPPPARVREQE